ncbi:MAG: DNA polymerase IV [Deltaproteobacteria bacterium]|nr:MAG: DNA polymerase IV [Deltaproteobacteria bacterium]
MKTIMHVDMNAFFAAVEQQSNPALRGRPVAVTGSEKRSIILTASYEARVFGVKTGMTRFEAFARCPQLTLVPANNRLYTHVSTGIMALFHDYTPLVEVFSIDEAFLDLSGSLKLFGGAERIAYLIKSRIKIHFGITCSVGIAPNKLLAKLASEQRKPDGLTIYSVEEISNILEQMPIQELCGIGRRLGRQLHGIGIFTCGQLGRFPLPILRKKYGVIGDKLHAMACGIDLSPVIPAEASAPIKSIGHSRTLRDDLDDRQAICAFLLQLAEMVGRRARRYQVSGRVITLTLRYADFTTFSRQQVQPDYLNGSEEIYRASVKILDSLNLDQPVRLLGVRLSSLRFKAGQLPLFPEERRQYLLTEARDCVNDRYGDFTVMFASLLEQKSKGSHVISPAWRPQGVRNVAVQ